MPRRLKSDAGESNQNKVYNVQYNIHKSSKFWNKEYKYCYPYEGRIGISTVIYYHRGSNPSGGEIFRTCPDRPWYPPSHLYNGYRVFPGGKERPGRDAYPVPRSSAVGHERVDIYLYSPYGPYGLYRASVPVQ
jgi:hypothetical protein